MADNVAKEFNDLDMSLLIGGPLKAACEAQVLLSKATADFITGVCMNDAGDKNLKARTVDFSFDRVRFDEEKNEEVTEKVSLNVPMLAIVKVPALGVEDVDITFDMEVKSSEASKNTVASTTEHDSTVGFKFGLGAFHTDIHVKGTVSTNKENTRNTDNSAKYHVQVHASQGSLPEGLSRVLDILASSIKPSVAPDDSVKAEA